MKKLFFMLLCGAMMASFTACEKDELQQEENNTFFNGHEAVDLGLQSGILWATCNLGATKPEQYGDYYAWAETFPKTDYSWTTYLYGKPGAMSKYIVYGSNPTVDRKGTLEEIDDAAVEQWGGAWRMPTEVELNELMSKCIWTWTTINGVEGYKVSSRVEGNNNSIFLPASGYKRDNQTQVVGKAGFYWSSTLSSIDYTHGRLIGFDINSKAIGGDRRFLGIAIRPVCQKTIK